MESRIIQMINEEVERQVALKIKAVLEHVSKTYDVSIKQLLKDASTLTADNSMCMGLTAKGKSCNRRACKKSNNGFCHQHQNQKPNVIRTVSTPVAKNQHNHDPGMFFVQGCPGCKDNPKLSVDI